MPTKVYWIDEPYIMGAEYIGNISEQDIEDVMAECQKYVDNQPIYFLVDNLQMTSLPPNVFKIASLMKLVNHPNTRWFVMVTGSYTFLKFAIQVIVRNRIKVVNNREEGLKFLRDMVAANIEIGEHDTTTA